jgi:hypothetical protein
MALSVPQVVAPGVADGLGAAKDEHVLVAGKAAEFAEAILSLLDNADDRSRLAAAGRRFVEERCDAERNFSVLGRLLAARRATIGGRAG